MAGKFELCKDKSDKYRWRLKAGQELCRAGDYGSTAFLLQAGTFEVIRPGGQPPIVLTPANRLLGEMTCLNFYPRNATVRATTDAEVFEVRRNLLFALQRVPESREILLDVYRRHAVESLIRTAEWFREVSPEDRDAARKYLLSAWSQPRMTPDSAVAERRQVELVQLAPGQVIYREPTATPLPTLAQRVGLPLVDLLGPFRAQSKSLRERIYFQQNGHWTADGHRLVARVVADALERLDLVPRG